MKSYPILAILVLLLVIFSCRETFGEQQNERNLPSQKSNKAIDSVPGIKDDKPEKPAPTRKKIKARDTLKPKIAALQALD